MTKSDASRDLVEVFLDTEEFDGPRRVGRLMRSLVRSDFPASFEYDPDWLDDDAVFMLDPRLELWPGEHHPPDHAATFGVFRDSTPDRWGRTLIERREALNAEKEGRKARRLQEFDFLLGVHDLTRMGALRLCRPGGPFLDDSRDAAPPVSTLSELARISRKVEEIGAEQLPEHEKWLATLIAPGSSLGGARPKACFTESDGKIWIAKFPARDDRYDVGAWEGLTHMLAGASGINVPPAKVLSLTPSYSTFCVERFDRTGTGRRMYASAMTQLEYQDSEAGGSYIELAEFLSDHGAKGRIEEDLEQLYRRVVFNILTGNRDDHLRNHGFIRETTGWRLSPAFDVNPNPTKSHHAIAIDELSPEPSVATALKTAPYYRLDAQAAAKIVEEIREAVARWRSLAAAQGLPPTEIRHMEPIFLV